ncbi:hypothetical protein CPC08DRAFT_679812 [Agrocybe pediades]|nr:hypothetical protein CPC08DRAFT_679812 [Agrocybe pediades]
MPNFSITVEDTSPLLRYSSNWQAGSSGDNLLDQYSQKSFMVTQKQGEAMSFDYYGTSVVVYGAKRFNHGTYSAQLDGGPVSSSTGLSKDALFNQVMYQGNASLGMHSLTITNGENQFFDVDYITFQTNVGKDDEELIVQTFQDNHPSFTYTPSSSWKNPTDRLGWFSGGTGHVTTDPAAVAKLLFQGDAIALYGSVGPSATDKYSVQIDGKSASTFSAKQQFYRAQEVLFYAGNLGQGNHTLQVQITSSTLGELGIDYADVYSTASMGASFLSTGGISETVFEKSTPKGLIAGLAVTSAIALFATVAAIYLVWRQRRTNQSSSVKHVPSLPQQPSMYQSPNNNQYAASSFYSVPAVAPVSTLPSSSNPSGPPTGTAISNASSGVVTSAPHGSQYTSGYLPQGKRHLEMTRARNEEPSPPQYVG